MACVYYAGYCSVSFGEKMHKTWCLDVKWVGCTELCIINMTAVNKDSADKGFIWPYIKITLFLQIRKK